MPLVPTIDSAKLREAAARVKEIDPEIRKELIANLKADLKPYADRIVSQVPSGAPISGFRHLGRTQWDQVKASVYVTPGGGKGSVARIEVFGKTNKAAFKIADRAGTRNRGSGRNRGYARETAGGIVSVAPFATRSGDAMIDALQQKYPLSAGGRGGRFAWANFMRYRPQFVNAVIERLDKYSQAIADRIVK
jgi:hypothetical protein